MEGFWDMLRSNQFHQILSNDYNQNWNSGYVQHYIEGCSIVYPVNFTFKIVVKVHQVVLV